MAAREEEVYDICVMYVYTPIYIYATRLDDGAHDGSATQMSESATHGAESGGGIYHM